LIVFEYVISFGRRKAVECSIMPVNRFLSANIGSQKNPKKKQEKNKKPHIQALD
jgi:hypothetical protein